MPAGKPKGQQCACGNRSAQQDSRNDFVDCHVPLSFALGVNSPQLCAAKETAIAPVDDQSGHCSFHIQMLCAIACATQSPLAVGMSPRGVRADVDYHVVEHPAYPGVPIVKPPPELMDDPLHLYTCAFSSRIYAKYVPVTLRVVRP